MPFTPNDSLNDFMAYELITEEDTPKKPSAPNGCLTSLIMLIAVVALLLWL